MKFSEIKSTELKSNEEKEFTPKIEDPGFNKRRDWDMVLIPVFINKVWSDQLPNVAANYIIKSPKKNKTGHGGGKGYDYIFMGTRDDSKAYAKAKLGLPLPDEHKDRVIFRLAKGGSEIMKGTSSYNSSERVVSISAENLSDEADYYIVCGYDKNKNGELEADERKIKDTIKLKIISRNKYESAVNFLKNVNVPLAPHATNLVRAFALSSPPSGAGSSPTTIAQSEPGIAHNVGVLFKPEANPGDSITAIFNRNSTLTRDIIKSNNFSIWLNNKLNSKREEVKEALRKMPENQMIMWFEWSFTGESLDFSKNLELDLFLALGKVSFDVTLEVPVHRSGRVDTELAVRVYGEMNDLYDFDREKLPPILDSGAFAQAGYQKEHKGGRVYRNKVIFDNNELPVSFNFY